MKAEVGSFDAESYNIEQRDDDGFVADLSKL